MLSGPPILIICKLIVDLFLSIQILILLPRLCAIFKKNIVQIWNMTSPEWRCKIDEGSSGLEATHFVPSSTQVLTLCDFQVTNIIIK